jgi:NAD(P)-dependent dehydrogenase (short-subunit alcohol dehydrogenase family)
MKLDDSAAMVTGGASGLGEATARQLRQRFPDLQITLVDMNDVRGREVAADIDATFVHADITSEDEVIAAVQAARTVHPLRAVVNCAGGGSSQRTIGRDGLYESAHPLALFERVLRLNAVGTFNVIRLATSAMSTNEPDPDGARGAIVNTASVAGLEGQIGQAAYAAGKAAIIGMTLPIARDLAAVGVRVNAIAPGTFDTPPMRAVAPELFKSLGASVPFPKRLGAPAEFASLAIELLTNGYINGATIRLDGAIRMAPK